MSSRSAPPVTELRCRPPRTRCVREHGSRTVAAMHDVLVVDDDAGTRSLLEAILGEAGFSVRGARDGREALDGCVEHMPDLILLDIEMPVMDGEQFLEQLRARYQPPPVVLVSAYRAGARARQLGVSRWLQKPLDERHGVSVVRSALSPA